MFNHTGEGSELGPTLAFRGIDNAIYLYDVLKKMQSYGIRRLPIVNERGGLAGILTFDDVLEVLSEELTDLARLVATEQKRERAQRQVR